METIMMMRISTTVSIMKNDYANFIAGCFKMDQVETEEIFNLKLEIKQLQVMLDIHGGIDVLLSHKHF